MSDTERETRKSPLATFLAKLKGLTSNVAEISAVVVAIGAAYGIFVPDATLQKVLIRVGIPIVGLTFLWELIDRVGARIVRTGKAPWPASFWQVVTGKLTHTPRELSENPVMLIVPEICRPDAQQVVEQLGSTRIYYHYLPPAGQKDETGWSDADGPQQTLEQLTAKLVQCSGVALLDKGDWKHYPQTLSTLRKWGDEYPARPIVAVHFVNTPQSPELAYSWIRYEKIVVRPEPLLQGLIDHSASRGEDWASLHRTTHRFARLGFCTGVVLLIATVLFGPFGSGWRQARVQPTPAGTFPQALKQFSDQVAVKRIDPKGIVPEQVQNLLDEYATYLKNSLPSQPDAVMFAVFGENDRMVVREIAASRPWSGDPPPLMFVRGDTANGVAACAYGTLRTIYWNGDTNDHETPTGYWRSWSITGDDADSTSTSSARIGPKLCRFQAADSPGAVDPSHSSRPSATSNGDPINELLCSPIGIQTGAGPTGVICVYRTGRGETLTSSRIRAEILTVGNLANFVDWRSADTYGRSWTGPVSPMPSPAPAARARRKPR